MFSVLGYPLSVGGDVSLDFSLSAASRRVALQKEGCFGIVRYPS